MKILLFAGTSEGRELTQILAGNELTVCVATGYGREVLLPQEGLHILDRPLDREEMLSLMQGGSYRCVIDATHPYATEASANITWATETAGLPLVRYLREEEPLPTGALAFADAPSAVEYLQATAGNILLTTGTNDLKTFCLIPNFRERVYVRVLPFVHSLEACARLGIPSDHILAMQGPFSPALNRALMEHWNIHWLVTKSSGSAGGFAAKIEAAADLGVVPIVLRRPPEPAKNIATTYEQVRDFVRRLTEEPL